jgi:hypothetical protein
MNTTKKRIMDRYEDLLDAIDAVKESPTSEHIEELKNGLNKILNTFDDGIECLGVVYTQNLDKLFFGVYAMPSINSDDVIDIITKDTRHLITKFYLELDSRLFGMDLALTTPEIAALILHDTMAITGSSAPVEEVKRAIDKYLKDNHEVLKLSDSIHYKEILSFGFRDAVRKYTTIFEKSKYDNEDNLVNDYMDWLKYNDVLKSAFDKIDKMGFNFNREVDNKFLTLSWVLRNYKDLKHNRIPAIKTLQKCQDLTPSQIEKKELNNMLRRITRIDDDALLESTVLNESNSRNLYKKLSIIDAPKKCKEKCDIIAIHANNIDQEPDAIPDLIHSVNNQMTMIDDYLMSKEEISDVELKQWNDMFKQMAKFRTKLEDKKKTLFDNNIKLKNTWKAQRDV